jgi:peptide chain release factor subunit 1
MSDAMSNPTTGLASPLRDQLDRLAAFEPVEAPVLSLYLDLRPDQHGRDNYASFLRKIFAERLRTFSGQHRKSFERDVERINTYLEEEARKSANGLAIFACAAKDDFFEPLQLDVGIDDHALYIASVPHLYPLAKVNDRYPRYAALLVNTNSARLFVFSLGSTEAIQQVTNQKTRKTMVGGWSQARYQRHVEHFHLQHMKEVVDALDRVVRDENIGQVVVACDETARPLLLDQLPKHLHDKVADVIALDTNAPDHQVLAATLETLQQKDTETDAEQVQAMLNAWRASGLAVAGPEATLTALSRGQVDELLIAADAQQLKPTQTLPDGASPGAVEIDTTAAGPDVDPNRVKLAGELVALAQQTSARIRFIEDPSLLGDVGGVGALLRFRF